MVLTLLSPLAAPPDWFGRARKAFTVRPLSTAPVDLSCQPARGQAAEKPTLGASCSIRCNPWTRERGSP